MLHSWRKPSVLFLLPVHVILWTFVIIDMQIWPGKNRTRSENSVRAYQEAQLFSFEILIWYLKVEFYTDGSLITTR